MRAIFCYFTKHWDIFSYFLFVINSFNDSLIAALLKSDIFQMNETSKNMCLF